MVATLLKRKTNRTKPLHREMQAGQASSLGYDFALLGLKNRESRVEVIRNAASKTAEKIQALPENTTSKDRMLSDLAVSTYRLLDPRKRNRSFERIQLCVYGEGDLELQKSSRTPILTSKKLVRAELVAEL